MNTTVRSTIDRTRIPPSPPSRNLSRSIPTTTATAPPHHAKIAGEPLRTQSSELLVRKRSSSSRRIEQMTTHILK